MLIVIHQTYNVTLEINNRPIEMGVDEFTRLVRDGRIWIEGEKVYFRTEALTTLEAGTARKIRSWA